MLCSHKVIKCRRTRDEVSPLQKHIKDNRERKRRLKSQRDEERDRSQSQMPTPEKEQSDQERADCDGSRLP
jgi:hypothetical protein